ncbi:FAD-dependent oxidoreductase [Mycolicibacterium goodii]|uniref:Oxidoreductase n=1 Tax=Mycolicibacterium goodii TaxID=134601 RepID=A0A0K0X433_MYCGD|nr:hypothetical protein AFA91_09795 [Mycolicibacterium goodii]
MPHRVTATQQQYTTLLSPFQLGSIELKNRVVMLPMGARQSRDGLASDADVAWLEERARGGVGLIITGGQLASPTAVVPSNADGAPGNVYRLMEAFRPEGVDAARRLVTAVHSHGTRIIGQLVHQGRDNSFQPGISSAAPIMAPSPIRTPGASDTPHELSCHEIEQLVTDFGISARNLQEAGYDGVELHGAHGYLIAQFLSPLANARTDRYGLQTIDNRTRFLRDIIAEVRRVCGRAMVLGVRLSADEEIPGGIDIATTKEIVGRIEQDGLIDYVSISRATRGNYVKDSSVAFGAARESAAAVRRSTELPVIAASRITTPALAEQILRDGDADLVGLGRALIADPTFVLKASGEIPGAIRPCIAFVQDCRQSVGGVLCGVNASASRERQWSAHSANRVAPRRIAVVGGGPGGLEAARLAAEAGHRVALWESSDNLGGQVLRAASAPHRGELKGLVEFQASEIHRLGVEVLSGTTATTADIASFDPDLTIVATGSRPHTPIYPKAGIPVVSTWAVHDGVATDLARVLVVDDGTGFWPVAGAAEILAARGAHVELVGPAGAILQNIPAESAPGLHRRLRTAGVTYSPFTTLADVDGEHALLRDSVTGETRRVAYTLVVVQSAQLAVPFDALPETVKSISIGDCVAPRRISHAILEANKAIRSMAVQGAGVAG